MGHRLSLRQFALARKLVGVPLVSLDRLLGIRMRFFASHVVLDRAPIALKQLVAVARSTTAILSCPRCFIGRISRTKCTE
jgi:hypothetical protein